MTNTENRRNEVFLTKKIKAMEPEKMLDKIMKMYITAKAGQNKTEAS